MASPAKLYGEFRDPHEKMLRRKHWLLFFPNSICCKVWDYFISFILIYVTFVLTFEIAFLEDPPLFFKVSEYVTTIFFFLDILYNFNKAYMNREGRLVVLRRRIACNYLKCWFWIDVVASFPFFLLTSTTSGSLSQGLKTTKILRIMNIVRLFRLAKLVKELFPRDTRKRSKKYFAKFKKNSERLVVHSFVVLIICHVFACAVYVLPKSFSPEQNWIEERGLLDRSSVEMYLFSMHWMVETIITVGYGENPFA